MSGEEGDSDDYQPWEVERNKTFVDIIGDIAWDVNYWIGNASIVIHVVVMFFFLIHFIKRDSTIHTPYFNMLFCCSFFELIRLLSWSAMLIHGWWDWGSTYQEVAGRTEWYSVLYTGCWNTALALNRFTAIMFPLKYDKIWSGKIFYIILLALILYPFAVDWPTISQFTLCWYAYMAEDCKDFGWHYQFVQACSNTTHAILSLSIAVVTMLGNRQFQIVKANNIERRLFYQSLYSSILWTCQTVVFSLAIISFVGDESARTNPIVTILLQFGYIVLGFHHYSTILMLFYLCAPFRKKFLQFYFPCWNKPKVFVVQSNTSHRSILSNNMMR